MFYIERKKRALAELKSAETTYKDIGTLANSKAISEQINLIMQIDDHTLKRLDGTMAGNVLSLSF